MVSITETFRVFQGCLCAIEFWLPVSVVMLFCGSGAERGTNSSSVQTDLPHMSRQHFQGLGATPPSPHHSCPSSVHLLHFHASYKPQLLCLPSSEPKALSLLLGACLPT